MGRVRQFAAALIAAVLAVVAAVLGVLALTVWKPANEVVASATPDQPYVMTRDGVLPLQGDGARVTVTVTAADPSATVDLVVGTPGDVLGWIGDAGYTEVVGIADGWTDLKVVDHPALGAAEPGAVAGSGVTNDSGGAPQSGGASQSDEKAESGNSVEASPLVNDMWLQQISGTGSTSLTLDNVPEGRSVLAAVQGSSTGPAITLTWAVPQGNGAAIGAFSLAVLFLIVAVVLFVVELRTVRHRRRRARQLRQRAEADVTSTQQLSVGNVMAQASGAHVDQVPVGDGDASTDNQEDAIGSEQDSGPTGVAGPDEDKKGTADTDKPVETTDQQTAGNPIERASLLGRHAASAPTGEQDPPEKVPTDSGLIDVSSIREGVAFPSRRALREARDRGEESFVIDGHEFDTGMTRRILPKDITNTPDTDDTSGWTSLMSGWKGHASGEGSHDAQGS